MCAPAWHAQACRSASSSACSQPASRRQSAQATGFGLRRRESRPASLGCRGLDSLLCDAKAGKRPTDDPPSTGDRKTQNLQKSEYAHKAYLSGGYSSIQRVLTAVEELNKRV
eukprot:scaffold47238_cov72-Phaeocystis_antarctica.AAC.10